MQRAAVHCRRFVSADQLTVETAVLSKVAGNDVLVISGGINGNQYAMDFFLVKETKFLLTYFSQNVNI